MSNQVFANNFSTLSVGDITDTSTSLDVPFDANPVFEEGLSYPRYALLTITDGINIEVVKATSYSAGRFTIVRGWEFTSHAFLAGSKVECRITANTLTELTKIGGTRLISRIDNGSESILLSPTSNSGDCTGDVSITIGSGAHCPAGSAIAIGSNVNCNVFYGFVHGGVSVVSKAVGFDDWKVCSSEQSILFLGAANLKTVADNVRLVTLPTNSKFFVDEVGLFITEATAITVAPQISFGIGASTTDLLATVSAGITGLYNRATFSPITKNGIGVINCSVKVAATGTSMTGSFYAKGFLAEI